jgi:DNA-binding XRE family transcriptional regulator
MEGTNRRLKTPRAQNYLNMCIDCHYRYNLILGKRAIGMTISRRQCRAARGLLNWSQQEISIRALVARKTIADFEAGQVTPQPRTLRDIVAAFESAGVEFLAPQENVAGPGVRLKWNAAEDASP